MRQLTYQVAVSLDGYIAAAGGSFDAFAQTGDHIDALLRQSGWVVQSASKIDFGSRPGQAVREYHTDVGPADYVLFVDRKAIGVIEAKREEEGQHLTAHETQTEGYAAAKLKWLNNREPLSFL